MKFNAHQYQKDAIDFLKKRQCAGLFADPGLGKTAITLHLIEHLWWVSNCTLKALIIAPLRVIYSVWPDEIDKWDLILSYSILHGKNKTDKPGHSVIDLLNVENIFWLLEQKKLPKYDLLIIDESSKFKGYSSKRFKALKKRLLEFNKRIILTGTPSPNSLEDLYSQIYIVDLGDALGPNITSYRRSYFDAQFSRKGRFDFVEYNLKPGADIVIQKKIAPLVKRIDAASNLNLPPLLEHTIEIDLPKKVHDIYKGFERDLFAELDSGNKLILSSAAAAYNTCRQIANGRFYEPPQPLELASKNRNVIQLHKVKIDVLDELIGELQGKPLLVAYHYKHDLEQLLEHFGRNTPIIGGKVSAKTSAQIITRWNLGTLPILLGHPQSMSHGINLQKGGNDIVWFSLTDNLENYIQFIRRIFRQGVQGQVRVHHIVAKHTVDEAIMRRLKSKDKTQRALLDALSIYRREKC